MNIKVKNNKYYGIQKKEGEYYIIPSKENPNKHDWVIAKIESEKDGFTLTENYKVVFTLEFEEPKPSCANYERDNKEETKWFDFAVMKAAQEHYSQSKECYDRWVQNNPLLSEMEQNVAEFITLNNKDKKSTEEQEQLLGSINVSPNSDPIIEQVRQKLLDRSTVGVKKYGEHLGNYSKYNFILEMQHEALDFANYCEVELQKEETINQLLKKYPNNFDLGTAIRKLYS